MSMVETPPEKIERKTLTPLVFFLALGITIHDIAVIEGVHVPGLHAYYFSVPIMLISVYMIIRQRRKKH